MQSKHSFISLPGGSLQVNCTLQELSLCKHSITDTGAEWICRHLRENTALLYLDISWYFGNDIHLPAIRPNVGHAYSCSLQL